MSGIDEIRPECSCGPRKIGGFDRRGFTCYDKNNHLVVKVLSEYEEERVGLRLVKFSDDYSIDDIIKVQCTSCETVYGKEDKMFSLTLGYIKSNRNQKLCTWKEYKNLHYSNYQYSSVFDYDDYVEEELEPETDDEDYFYYIDEDLY